MRCPNCKKDMQRDRGTHHYTESGLTNIYLRDWEMYKCSECGVAVPLLPSAKVLADLIAWATVRFPERLDADAILFLRKTMGLTAAALAEELGVHRVEVSRWENGHVAISHSAEFKLRMAVMRRVIPDHLKPKTKLEIMDLFMRCKDEQREAQPETINVRPEMAQEFAYAF
jgi:putative zinc finger/helix-turn-helix YgiT family protein